MIPLPSRRLLRWGTLAAVASVAVLALPGALLPLVACDVVLAAVALLDWLLTPAPRALEVLRAAPDHMSVLDEHVVALVLRNRSRLALQVRLRDSVPETFRADAEELAGVVLAREEVRWQYRVTPAQRGLTSWGLIYLRYRSPLGLWERQKRVEAAGEVRVYPSLAALYRYHLLARSNRLEALGIRRVRQRGSAWEFESLRDYALGDDTRLIDWKATARHRRLVVRNQEAERNQTVLLLVDCGRLMNAEVDGVAKLDHAVNTALVLAHVALIRGDRVGLCTFSHRVHAWVAPRPHRAQMRLITDTLYDLRGDFTETDHGRCLRLLAARHRKRALLVVLTDFVDADTAADMIAHLRRASRQHLVLFAALRDPFLGRAARSRPATAFEGFRKAAAAELLHERREVLGRIRQLGAHVLDVEPTGITPPLISRYLEITFRGQL
jgi:uncharacterized protein (DUF58 family)